MMMTLSSLFDELLNFIQVHEQQNRPFLLLDSLLLVQPLLPYTTATQQEAYLEQVKQVLEGVDKHAQSYEIRYFLHAHAMNIAQQCSLLQKSDIDAFEHWLIDTLPTETHAVLPFKPTYKKWSDLSPKTDDVYDTLRTLRVTSLMRLEHEMQSGREGYHQDTVFLDSLWPYWQVAFNSGQKLTLPQWQAMTRFFDSVLWRVTTKNAQKTKTTDTLKANAAWFHFHAFRYFILERNQAHLSALKVSSLDEVTSPTQAGLHLAHAVMTLPHGKSEAHLHAWGQEMIELQKRLCTLTPTLCSPLLQSQREALKQSRQVFQQQEPVAAQQAFSQSCLGLLRDWLQEIETLLGEAPCHYALCALGSTSRLDRMPYSDIELMLVYAPSSSQVDLHARLYVFLLVWCLELAIVRLGETHQQYAKVALSQNAGFHIDSSSHLLLKGLIGTVEEVIQTKVISTLAEGDEKHHPVVDDESLYSLLSPLLINDQHIQAQALLKQYHTNKKHLP